MKRKKFATEKTIIVLLITIIVFSLGIMLGNYNSNKKVNKVMDISEELQIDTLGVEVEFAILEENICANNDVLFLTKNLFDLSEKLGYMENTLGSDNKRVIEMKNYYFILEAKHWLLAKKRIKTCFTNEQEEMNKTIILYFYSNKGDCPQCQQQGAVISYLHKLYAGMKVYSFDTNSESPVVGVLKQLYGIGNETPTLVINDEVYPDYIDADQLINFVNERKEEKLNTTINNQGKELNQTLVNQVRQASKTTS